jgi:hypothetical protein
MPDFPLKQFCRTARDFRPTSESPTLRPQSPKWVHSSQTPEIQPAAQETALRALSENNVRHPIVGTVESIDCILVQRVWRWHFIGVRIDWRKTGPWIRVACQTSNRISFVSQLACMLHNLLPFSDVPSLHFVLWREVVLFSSIDTVHSFLYQSQPLFLALLFQYASS